jgi:hypothetical protein
LQLTYFYLTIEFVLLQVVQTSFKLYQIRIKRDE